MNDEKSFEENEKHGWQINETMVLYTSCRKTAKEIKKENKKVVDKTETTWYTKRVAVETDNNKKHFENRRLNSM